MLIVLGVLFHLVLGLIHLGQSHLEVHVLILDQEGLLGRFLAQFLVLTLRFIIIMDNGLSFLENVSTYMMFNFMCCEISLVVLVLLGVNNYC